MKNNRSTPSVNAGSMADIAFLLLIFFLVTTTIPNDKGIARKLPPPCLEPPCGEKINERNILRVSLNKQGELLVEDDITAFSELKDVIKKFIDNNGDQSCDYCAGDGKSVSSDNPTTAVIALSSDRASKYDDFIQVQVALNKAYYELREDFILKTFGKEQNQLTPEEFNTVKAAYPLLISEAEVK